MRTKAEQGRRRVCAADCCKNAETLNAPAPRLPCSAFWLMLARFLIYICHTFNYYVYGQSPLQPVRNYLLFYGRFKTA